jgi:Fe2+ or Zn2+ uptake regulation protein
MKRSTMSTEEDAFALELLRHPLAYEVLSVLRSSDTKLSLSEICLKMKRALPTVFDALHFLELHGVVGSEKVGRQRLYFITKRPIVDRLLSDSSFRFIMAQSAHKLRESSLSVKGRFKAALVKVLTEMGLHAQQDVGIRTQIGEVMIDLKVDWPDGTWVGIDLSTDRFPSLDSLKNSFFQHLGKAYAILRSASSSAGYVVLMIVPPEAWSKHNLGQRLEPNPTHSQLATRLGLAFDEWSAKQIMRNLSNDLTKVELIVLHVTQTDLAFNEALVREIALQVSKLAKDWYWQHVVLRAEQITDLSTLTNTSAQESKAVKEGNGPESIDPEVAKELQKIHEMLKSLDLNFLNKVNKKDLVTKELHEQ